MSDNATTPETWITPRRFAALLALLILTAFPDVLLSGSSFVVRDFGLFGYPLAHYHRECFWRGEIPLWNPLNQCGIPFLAQWNTLTLYPGSLIYLLLPLPWSLSFFCVGHLYLAGLGMYFLGRHWTGSSIAGAFCGIAFAFSGLLQQSLMWPNNIAAFGWMPWVVLAVQAGCQKGRRPLLLAALAGAVQMLSGAPEIIFFTWLIIGLHWLATCREAPGWRISIARLLLIVAMIAGLCAIQLLPFLDLLRHSLRDTSYGTNTWSMPAWGWINLFVPLFRCFPTPLGFYFQADQNWTSSYYSGIGTLALAIWAAIAIRQKRTWLLAGIAIGSLLLALGERGLVYTWLIKLVPQFGFMRFPVKFVILSSFALPLLGAFAVARFCRPSPPPVRPAIFPALFLWLAFAIIMATALFHAHAHPLRFEDWTVYFKNGVSRFAFLTAILVVAVFVSRGASRPVLRSLQIGLLVLVWLDGLTHAPRLHPTVRPDVFQPGLIGAQLNPRPRPGVARAMLRKKTFDDLLDKMWPDTFNDYLMRRASFYGDCNLLDDLATPDGLYSLYGLEQRQVWATVYYAPGDKLPEGLTDFLGVQQITRADKLFAWKTRPNFLPFASIGQRPVFVEPAQIIPRLSSPGFDPRAEVFFPLEMKPRIVATNGESARIISQEFTAHRQTFNVKTDRPTLLVLSQTFYHPWKATLDGRASEIWKANHAYQSIVVPAGRHQIRLIYDDKMFLAGAVLSGITILLWTICWVIWKRP